MRDMILIRSKTLQSTRSWKTFNQNILYTRKTSNGNVISNTCSILIGRFYMNIWKFYDREDGGDS